MGAEGAGEAGTDRREARAVAWLIAAFALLWSGLALARFEAVHNRTFDLAIYTRMAWGLTRGQLWDPIVDGHFLAPHLPLVMLPLALLGRVAPLVPTLLFAQALALALAAWPLARFGRRHLGPGAGLLAAVLWLLYPNLGHVATYELHPGAFAMAPLAWSLDALDRRDARSLLLASVLVLACRASFAPIVACVGVLALFSAGALRPAEPSLAALRRAGVWLVGGSAAYLALMLGVLAPRFAGADQASLSLHFGLWGGSPLGVLPALVQDPGRVLAHFTAAAKLAYLPWVLAPLALLPLLAPRWLWVAAPTLALNLASSFPTTSELYSHYLTPAVVPLVVGALAGMATLVRWQVSLRRPAMALVMLTTAATGWWAGALPGARSFPAADFRADARTASRRAALAVIPAAASVQAPDPLLPHLAQRLRVHRAPPPERETAFVVLDVSHRGRYANQEALLRTVEEPVVRRWLARGDHALVHAGAELLVLARGQAPRTGLARRYLVGTTTPRASDRKLTACLSLRGADWTADGVALSLVAHAACDADLALRLGAEPRPRRVVLAFDGLLSPAELRAGDLLRSHHAVPAAERAAIAAGGLWVGVLRESGARPARTDPYAVRVSVAR